MQLTEEPAPDDHAPPGDTSSVSPVTEADAAVMMRRRRKLAERLASAEAAAAAIVADAHQEAEAFMADVLADVGPRIQALDQALIAWLRARIDGHPNPDKAPKSHKLPYGRIVSKAGGLSTEVEDQPALLAWLTEARPDLIATPPAPPARPDIAALKAEALAGRIGIDGDPSEPGAYKLVDADGSPIPGVALVRDDRKFEVKVDD